MDKKIDVWLGLQKDEDPAWDTLPFVKNIIKNRTGSKYFHSVLILPRAGEYGIKSGFLKTSKEDTSVSFGRVFHANLSDGVHIWKRILKDHFFDFIKLRVQEDLYIDIQERFSRVQGAKYDLFSLLAFVGLRVRDSKRFYCYELTYFLLTGELAKRRISVEDLLQVIMNLSQEGLIHLEEVPKIQA